MKDFKEEISALKNEGATLFYNSSGSKEAYQLGIMHLGAARSLGFTQHLAGYEKVLKDFYLVDMTQRSITLITQGSKLTLIPLESIKD